MLDKRIIILSTREVAPPLIDKAAEHHILIHQLSLIQIQPLRNETLKKQINDAAGRSLAVAFTSANAAEAVAGYLDMEPLQWKIYCIGHATKKIVAHHFHKSSIVDTADHAGALADKIIRDRVKTILFFCGDQRRNELPLKLATAGILVEEVTVYQTSRTPQKIETQYNGILFFSPTAVESFFSVNTISNDTVLFAIGSTTAGSIRQFSNNTIIQSDSPGKDSLAEKAITYFKTLKPVNEHIKK